MLLVLLTASALAADDPFAGCVHHAGAVHVYECASMTVQYDEGLPNDAAATVGRLRARLEAEGGAVFDEQTLPLGTSAAHYRGKEGGAEVEGWIVADGERGGRLGVCTARVGPDARTRCEAALTRLWTNGPPALEPIRATPPLAGRTWTVADACGVVPTPETHGRVDCADKSQLLWTHTPSDVTATELEAAMDGLVARLDDGEAPIRGQIGCSIEGVASTCRLVVFPSSGIQALQGWATVRGEAVLATCITAGPGQAACEPVIRAR